jgi:dynactin complex subunit
MGKFDDRSNFAPTVPVGMESVRKRLDTLHWVDSQLRSLERVRSCKASIALKADLTFMLESGETVSIENLSERAQSALTKVKSLETEVSTLRSELKGRPTIEKLVNVPSPVDRELRLELEKVQLLVESLSFRPKWRYVIIVILIIVLAMHYL